MRGTRQRRSGRHRIRRFIPACAGNSSPQPLPLRPRAVHPRVCGELEWIHCLNDDTTGSSPRVRGTPADVAEGRRHGRFIPACAGNSSPQPLPLRPRAVHPRVCGELEWIHCLNDDTTGSSPRVRGTRPMPRSRRRPRRFIPACAGNSLAPLDEDVAGFGSSPRVRGTRHAARPLRRDLRFIPACAGNSSYVLIFSAFTAVHPRVCGELCYIIEVIRDIAGSSPRVRGTR